MFEGFAFAPLVPEFLVSASRADKGRFWCKIRTAICCGLQWNYRLILDIGGA
jgi:hypothetical protein